MLLLGAILLAFFIVPRPWGFVLIALAAVFEVAETWFFIRLSQRRKVRVGAEAMIGARGLALSDCLPVGQVRVSGEIWQARCEEGVLRGDAVRVTALEGLTLLVQPVP